MRFASSVARQRSSDSSQTGVSSCGQTPATAAQTSIPPSAARASAKSLSASASSVRSAWNAGAPPSSVRERQRALRAAM